MADDDPKETMDVEEEEKEKPRADIMILAERKFLLTLPDATFPAHKKQAIKQELLDDIEKNSRAPMYKYVCGLFEWKEDEQLYSKLKQSNDEELKKLTDAIELAEKDFGDTEVREAQIAVAHFYARIGDKATALEWYGKTLEKTAGVGSKIDLIFAIIRMALFFSDTELLRTHIDKAQSLVEKGGDWERRNLLKVYTAVYHIITRDFKQAAKLLLDSVATFTCYELFDYNTFIFYTVIASVVSLDRPVFRDKVVHSPDILSVQHMIPHLQDIIQSLYRCRYKDFFQALVDISGQLKRDPFFAPHFGFFMREVRIVALQQFLRSYRSVTLQSMAAAFGLSVPFLDKELSRFIASGRLNCKIDKVNGIVETNRPDAKNAQYQATIKQGDLLLNRIQKLTKTISY